MAHKIDVAVVGSGPGGCIAGAYLAKAGMNTVVFEREKAVAGLKYGSHYIADGFLSDNHMHMTTWWMGLNGGRGCWIKAAQEVGAAIKWQCLPSPVVYLEGQRKSIVVPYCSCGKAFADFVGALSPVPLPDDTKQEMAALMDEALRMPHEELWSPEAESITFGSWLNQKTDNELIKSVLAILASTAVVLPTEVALEQTSMSAMVSLIFKGVLGGETNFVGIVGDDQGGIVRAFSDVITGHGGQVLTSHPVRRIIVEGGEGKGVSVITPKGDEETYEAKYVVMAACYPNLKQLMGEHLPERVKEAIDGFDMAHNYAIDVHFALRSQAVDPGSTTYMIVLDEGLKFKGYVSFPSNFEPCYAPAGKQQVGAETFIPKGEFKKRGKDAIVKELTDMVEGIFPGFKEEIEATSVTMFAPATSQVFVTTPKVPLECPGIDKVYFVGDYTMARGLGPERAADSAMTVAKNILRREGARIS